MQKVQLGKIVFINGPPFSGKTYLVSQLLNDVENCKVVNYERFWKNGGYPLFYRAALDFATNGHNVIAESASTWFGSDEVDKCPYSFEGVDNLHILVFPSREKHMHNFNRFKSFAGNAPTRQRIGPLDIDMWRKNVKIPKPADHLVYDGENYEEIKRIVLNYVICNK
jgi:hypothetical protein